LTSVQHCARTKTFKSDIRTFVYIWWLQK